MDTCERRTRDAEASASSAPLRSDRTGDVVKNMRTSQPTPGALTITTTYINNEQRLPELYIRSGARI